MEDPNLLRLILHRSDTEVIDLLTRSGLRVQIVDELKNQHTWFLRVQSQFNLPDWADWNYDKNKYENWQQVYNILDVIRTGENPFLSDIPDEKDILVKNSYNLLAIKLLLHWGYDPSVDQSDSIRVAAGYGSPEVLKLLLSDPRIDPLGKLRLSNRGAYYALSEAAKNGRIDNIQVLLSNPRIQKYMTIPDQREELLSDGILGASEGDQLEVATFLLDLYNSNQSNYESIQGPLIVAIEHGSLRVLRLLLSKRRLLDIIDGEDLLERAIGSDQPDSLKLILQLIGKSLGDILIELIPRDGGPRVTKMILEDKIIDSLDIMYASEVAAEEPNSEVLSVLLEDPRATHKITQITYNDGSYYSDDVIRVLTRSKQLVLEELSKRDLEYIIKILSSSIQDSLEGAELLSGMTPSMQYWNGIITKIYSDYSESHINILLREIVLKRRDLSYYLDWITSHLESESTSQDLRDVISSAAESILSSDPVRHTSDMFTAYSGFFLLANSRQKNGRAIMSLLEQEEGITREGLLLAGVLIGAFLGITELEKE